MPSSWKTSQHAATRPDLGTCLDEIYPRLFDRLDGAFPEFGFVQRGEHWVATLWPASLPAHAQDKRPERLIVYKDRPHWIKLHGHHGVRFLDLVNNGRKPTGPEFRLAVEALARLADYPLPGLSPEEAERSRQLEARRDVLQVVIDHAQEILHSPAGDVARAFLATRGLSAEQARELGVGLYLDRVGMKRALELAGASLEVADDAAVLWEKLEGYITFPWSDAVGRPLTIYGRWPGNPPEDRPKTIALPGADTKGVPLYFDRARKGGHKDLVLVEGVLDAAILQLKGDTRVVACVAAQLSGNQVETLKRYKIESVTIALDPDEGGDRGVVACVESLGRAGIAAFVAPRLPEKQDPDEFVIANGLPAWLDHIRAAETGVRFRARAAIGDVTPESSDRERNLAIGRVKTAIAGQDLELVHEDLVKLLAEKTGYTKRAIAKRLKPPASNGTSDVPTYREVPDGIVWNKPTAHGHSATLLTNFHAKIVGDVSQDDGLETKRVFELEAELHGTRLRFNVPAEKYRGMRWVAERLGPSAQVSPDPGCDARTAHAIQVLSGTPPERKIYTHTGWREIEGRWTYLHADGGIGPEGPDPRVIVQLPDKLALYRLPAPPTGEELVKCLRANLRLLELAAPRISFPLLATAFRAALGPADFTTWVAGPTGSFKSEITALVQQHWGAELHARNLPGSWDSTANALEGLAFLAKDAVFVVDDFAPKGSSIDIQRIHKDADRLIRGQGNRQGRQRMSADAGARPTKYPRGVVLSSGEDVPRGQSCRSRIFIVELTGSSVSQERLTECQADAGAGLYARTFSAFVRWAAPKYDRIKDGLRAEIAELRAHATSQVGHKRTPGIVADLAIGLRHFLAFALEAGAIDAERHKNFWQTGWDAFMASVADQNEHQVASEPAHRFVELLSAAIATGKAHLADLEGSEPREPTRWGWRGKEIGLEVRWEPAGERIGWVEGEDVFLDPDASYATATRLGEGTGDRVAVGHMTLRRRLGEQGFLVSRGEEGQHLTVRRTIQKARRWVLHFRAAAFEAADEKSGSVDRFPEPAEPF